MDSAVVGYQTARYGTSESERANLRWAHERKIPAFRAEGRAGPCSWAVPVRFVVTMVGADERMELALS
jgi:hypothetical protein